VTVLMLMLMGLLYGYGYVFCLFLVLTLSPVFQTCFAHPRLCHLLRRSTCTSLTSACRRQYTGYSACTIVSPKHYHPSIAFSVLYSTSDQASSSMTPAAALHQR